MANEKLRYSDQELEEFRAKEQKDFTDFVYRLTIQSKRLDSLNVNYAKHFLFSVKNKNDKL